MTTLWFDTETFSECDLKVHGTHVYAEHPSTQIIVAQWAIDDDEPRVFDCADLRDRAPKYRTAAELVDALHDPTVIIVAHSSHFDRTILRHCWGIDVPVERWRDTMVKALAHGLPGGLDKVGQVLGLEDDKAKDKRGRELIQLFCKPRPKNQKLRRATRETHPREWAEFLEYSRQDIVAMREVARRLPSWNYRDGHPELALWHLDQRINDRGFAVDLELAHAAVAATQSEKERIKGEVRDATDGLVSGPSKRDDLLAFILAEYGVELPDMKADTLRRRLEDPELPEGVKLLISLRLEATKASTAKYKAAINSTSADGRMRNTQQFCGAQRTGRVAHRLFQPGNMPRPDMDAGEIELGIEALKAGVADLVCGDVMRLAANAVRGCIVAPPGRKKVIADLANIEGRGLVYLAGEAWKLQAFRDYDAGAGPDLYCVAYGRSFGVDPSTVKGQARQIGKVQELGLGYEGGVAAFLTFAAVYNMDLAKLADAVHSTAPKEVLAEAYRMHEWTEKKRRSTHGLSKQVWVACESLKIMWREAHPMTVALWKEAKEQTEAAILNPGVVFDIGEHLRVRRDGAWLRLRLPSGRYLCYLQPKVEDGQITYMGVNQYTRQWGRIKTYGGKLIENATQAFARDVMFYNLPAIEQAGYEVTLTVHDEVVTETPDDPAYNAEHLGALLATVPAWAPGIPLSAAGFETYRYRKD